MAKCSDTKYLQSAVVPFVFKNGMLKVLLISSRSGKRWVIPKGIIEDDLTSLESAVEEAYEEAGIKRQSYKKAIGNYQYPKWDGNCHVEVFLFEVNEVLKEWPEAHFRQRAWVTVEEAAERVDEKALKSIIRRVPELVDKIPVR